MTTPPTRARFDWRIWLGLVLTFAWLALGAAYVSAHIGWGRVSSLDAATLGNFLEGAFAPLAFLWLVIGYFLQRKELEQNTEALRTQSLEIQRSADQAIIQSERMVASERHAHQEAFLRLSDTVGNQLGAIAGLLFVSSQGAAADGAVSDEEISKLFATASAQDPEIFSRRLVELNLGESDSGKQFDLFYGTEVRARHTNNFIYTFERLLARAKEVDRDNILRDALMANGHGFAYRRMKQHQANAPEALADMRVTGTYIDF